MSLDCHKYTTSGDHCQSSLYSLLRGVTKCRRRQSNKKWLLKLSLAFMLTFQPPDVIFECRTYQRASSVYCDIKSADRTTEQRCTLPSTQASCLQLGSLSSGKPDSLGSLAFGSLEICQKCPQFQDSNGVKLHTLHLHFSVIKPTEHFMEQDIRLYVLPPSSRFLPLLFHCCFKKSKG